MLAFTFFFQGNDFGKLFKHVEDIYLEQKTVFIGSVKGCYVDLDVGIFISDPVVGDVKVYNFNGKLIGFLGKKGKGPGEFQSPFGLCGDEEFIYVADPVLRSVLIFGKKDFKFKRQIRVYDARDVRVVNGKFFISAPYVFSRDMVYSLHIYDFNGKKLKSVVQTPDVVVKNNFISDGVLMDNDANGNIYVAHEMEYKIYKIDVNGNILAEFYGKNKSYIPPPKEPFMEFFSRDRIKKWAESWVHVDRLVVLKKSGLIVVSLARFNPSDFIIDIYDLNGNLIYVGIRSKYRLYCCDSEDNLYFIERVEGDDRIDFIVKKYKLIIK